MATIRLYTTTITGQTSWVYHAKKEGDTYFGTFLTALRDATGTLPDELQLAGEVANILQSEWDDYKAIWAASRVVEATLEAMKTVKGEGEINKLSPLQVIPMYTKPVTLDQVAHIVNLLDTPRGWEAYVMVTRISPLSVQVNHLVASVRGLAAMGMDMTHVGTVFSLRQAWSGVGTTLPVLSLLARTLHRSNEVQDSEDYKYTEATNSASVALLHNEQLNSMSSFTHETSLYDILWDAVPGVLKRLDAHRPQACYLHGSPRVHLSELAALLTGRGDVFALPSDLLTVRSKPSPSVDIADGRELERLYEAVWKSTPDNVYPHLIGLDGYITKKMTHRDAHTTGCTDFLRHIHRAIIHPFFTEKHGKFVVEDFCCVIALFGMSIVNEYGIRRIILCLEKHLPAAGEKDKQRIHCFLHYAKYYDIKYGGTSSRRDFPVLEPGVTIQSITDDLFAGCPSYVASTD